MTLQRLERYARETDVRFAPVARHSGLVPLGVPYVRGFTPHLRTVRRFAGEPAEFPRAAEVASGAVGLDDLETGELWLLHDLAHVAWYDVAAVTFGAARFAERDFFLEQHLASEAFAVLLLDYHLLAQTRHRGLAVDLDASEWSALRTRVRGLPELRSYDLCRELVTQYLAGDSPLFRERGPGRLVARGADADALARWRDHERSYSDKQRWYVFLWWDDLAQEPLSNRRAVVEDAQIAELVWIALRLFTVDAETAFTAHVERVRARLKGVDHYFERLPKYAVDFAAPAASATLVTPDFRFTDALALPKERVQEIVAGARAPRSATLFLLWQVLAMARPERLSAAERESVATLARSVQTPEPDLAAWNAVRELCERTLVNASWTPRPDLRSSFFLP